MPHLVLARTDQSLDWLEALAPDWQVSLFHSGEAPDVSMLGCPAVLHQLSSVATPSALLAEAILMQVQAGADGAPDDVTVFACSDVLDHAPDLPALLDLADRFADVQPLSAGTGLAARLAQTDDRDWIDHWAVRAERFSLATLVPLSSAGEAALKAGRTYRRQHALAEGDNLLAHFLSLLGLDQTAARAMDADVGVMVHGPVFAVRNHRLDEARRDWGRRVDVMLGRVRAEPTHADLLGQAWLHVFGLPFIALPGLAAEPQTAFQPVAPGLERVVASIDAVLAHAEPKRRTPRALEAIGPPVLSDQITPPPGRAARQQASVPALREQAHRAASQGDPLTAWMRLDQALQLAPNDIDLLADAASLAYQQGDHLRAMQCARRALDVEPQHLDCLFTLGMCLAAQGHADEAMNMLARLGEHPQAAAWQAAYPDLGMELNATIDQLGGSGAAVPAGRLTI